MRSYPAIQTVDARLESFDNLSNATDFIEFYLQFIDFVEDCAEAGDFSISHLHGIACVVVLHLGCCLCLLGELAIVSTTAHRIEPTQRHNRRHSHTASAAG
jgi:hypothetical protein